MIKSLLAKHSAPKKIQISKSDTVSAGFTNEDRKVIEGPKMQASIAKALVTFGLTVGGQMIGPMPIILGQAAGAAIKAAMDR